jgi:hypothetical protein
MFCAFSGAPNILRLYGKGKALAAGRPGFDEFAGHFAELPGARQIVDVAVEEIITSCGFGVPLMEFAGQRDTLVKWAEKKGEDGISAYWREKNAMSFDGIPTGVLDE